MVPADTIDNKTLEEVDRKLLEMKNKGGYQLKGDTAEERVKSFKEKYWADDTLTVDYLNNLKKGVEGNHEDKQKINRQDRAGLSSAIDKVTKAGKPLHFEDLNTQEKQALMNFVAARHERGTVFVEDVKNSGKEPDQSHPHRTNYARRYIREDKIDHDYISGQITPSVVAKVDEQYNEYQQRVEKSRNEAITAGFIAADTDGDGSLSAEELRKALDVSGISLGNIAGNNGLPNNKPATPTANSSYKR